MIFGRRATPPQPSPARRGGSTSAAQEVGGALAFCLAPPPVCRGRLGGGEALDLLDEEQPHPNPPLHSGEGAHPPLRKLAALCCRLDLGLAWLGFASALLLIQLLQTVRAGRAPALPGPLCGGEVGSIGPEGGIGRTPIPFRQDRSPVEKPGPSSRTCWAWMPSKRQAGWPSLLVTSLLATQEKSDSPSVGG